MGVTSNNITRRQALKGIGAFGALAAGGSGGVLFSTATPVGAHVSQPGWRSDTVLLTVFLRGAADGLNIVIPVGDIDAYTDLRPTIGQIPAPGQSLDTWFSLNDDFAAVMPLYNAGELAFVHAIGSEATTRSHFSAMDNMDTALAGPTGWLWRANEAAGHTAPVAGIGVGTTPNPSLRGTSGSAPSIPSVASFTASRQFDAMRRARLLGMYASQVNPEPNGATFANAAQEGFVLLDAMTAVPDPGIAHLFNPDPAGAACLNAALLIRADIGIRAITIDIGGNWDHHTDEMAPHRLPQALSELGHALAALREALEKDFARTTTLVISEFGRTARENGAAGTDHGTGNVMMIMGGDVAGGQVLLKDGSWPGLGDADLVDGQDLEVTTDFREVFADVTRHQFGDVAVAALAIAPHLSTEPTGIFRGQPLGPLTVMGEWLPPLAQTNLMALRVVVSHDGPRLRSIDGFERDTVVQLGSSQNNGPWETIHIGSTYPFVTERTTDFDVAAPDAVLSAFSVRWATRGSSGSLGPWTVVPIDPLP